MPDAIPRRLEDGRRAAIAAAAAAAAVAAGAAIPGAVALPLWQDEVASARVILEATPAGVLDHATRTESTPPGWYLLAWLGRRAGVPLEELRFVSVALAAALAGLTVLYARRFLPLPAAALAGLLTALAWQAVVHASELRAYALLAFLTLVFGLLLERAAASATPGRLVAVAACAAAGAYTHYFFLLAAAAGLAWLAMERPRWALRAGSAVLAGSATLLAWLPGLLEQARAQRFGWIDTFDPIKLASLPSALFWDPGTMYAELGADPGAAEAAVRLALLAVVLAGCAALWRRGPSARLGALLVLVPFALSGVAWAGGLRVVTARNLVGATAFTAVALAAALLPLPRRAALAAGAAGLALALSLYLRTPMAERVEFDRVAATLVDAGWTPGDPILVVGSLTEFRSPLEWYLPGRVTLAEAVLEDPCVEMWVVTDVPAGRSLLDLADPAVRSEVGSAEVARIAWSDGLAAEAAAGDGSYLASPAAPGCLRPVEDRVI